MPKVLFLVYWIVGSQAAPTIVVLEGMSMETCERLAEVVVNTTRSKTPFNSPVVRWTCTEMSP